MARRLAVPARLALPALAAGCKREAAGEAESVRPVQGAIVAPAQVRRSTALKNTGGDALGIELGCMVMLVIAGLIEGFVSPSGIDYASRITVLAASLGLWALYFLGAGHKAVRAAPLDPTGQLTGHQ